MSALHQTPSGERLHITILGRRNSGKSTLINALTGQDIAIVSPVAGTTTDPVPKAMEILPLGPVIITDTAGIDDMGELGEQRVERTLRVLEKTDMAILVLIAGEAPAPCDVDLVQRIRDRKIPCVIAINKSDLASGETGMAWAQQLGIPTVAISAKTKSGIADLKNALIQLKPDADHEVSLVGDLLSPGDTAVLVVPIDQAAPKGRLILPQVMTLRDILDHDAQAMVVKERELAQALRSLANPPKIVITDSQAFLKVAADTPRECLLTSFSILMARHKGNLTEFARGAKALGSLKPGDEILIAEGCTHHRQGDDIGTVQIPRWLRQRVGGELNISHAAGQDFPEDVSRFKVIVHCGSCTLNRREVLYRQRLAREAGVPMTNYGIALAYVHGILDRALQPFPGALAAWREDKSFAALRGLKWRRAIE